MAKTKDPNCSIVDVVKPGIYLGAVDAGQMYDPLEGFDSSGKYLASHRAHRVQTHYTEERLAMPLRGIKSAECSVQVPEVLT